MRGHEHVVEVAVFVPSPSIPAVRELVSAVCFQSLTRR
jgi:hypothetical protein